MKERITKTFDKDWPWLLLLGAILVLFFHKLLFTDQIIRASDIASQYFWTARDIRQLSLLDWIASLPGQFQASWSPLSDGGRTLEGGWNAIGLLFHRYFIQHFFPFPSSIAWLVVLAMCWGAIGTFLYCRLIGVSRLGAFAAGLLYVICTENASLINAGHIQKFEAICWVALDFPVHGKRAAERKALSLRHDGADAGHPVLSHALADIVLFVPGRRRLLVLVCGGEIPGAEGGIRQAVQEGFPAGGGDGGALFHHHCHVVRPALQLVAAVRTGRGGERTAGQGATQGRGEGYRL